MSIGVICAMGRELAVLRASSELEELHIHPFESGVGKVNASIAAHWLIYEAEVETIIVVGTAGSIHPELNPGDVLVSREAIQHDVDVRALGFNRGFIPFNDKSLWIASGWFIKQAVLAAREQGWRVRTGTVLTGDRFIADAAEGKELFEEFNGHCVEMEGAAVAQVCDRTGTPWVIIRIISDNADKHSPIDFEAFLDKASEKIAHIVLTVARKMKEWPSPSSK